MPPATRSTPKPTGPLSAILAAGRGSPPARPSQRNSAAARRGGHVADQRHRTGKGHVEKGESGERTQWRDREWRTAREDHERQNPDRDDRDDDRGLFW